MTTIRDLSEENLLMIFKDFTVQDLRECQIVCRSWYPLVHQLILKNVDLQNTKELKRFIVSINHNPKPSYLQAVNKITIRGLDVEVDENTGSENNEIGTVSANDVEDQSDNVTIKEDEDEVIPAADRDVAIVKFETEDEIKFTPPFWHNKNKVEKFITRFPNIEELHLIDSLDFVQEFDDELCNTISKGCPKFNVVGLAATDCNKAHNRYCDALYKVRQFVKSVDVKMITDITRFGDVTQFLTSFPYLTKIINPPPQLDTFEKWLPVFGQLPNLKDFQISSTTDDQTRFTEDFLKSKSKEEQEVILNRLSEVEKLHWTSSSGACLYSLKFLAKYLKRLSSLTLDCVFTERSTDTNQRQFCSVMYGLINYLEDYSLTVKMKTDVLSEYLPVIISTLFFQAGTHNEEWLRYLEICVDNTAAMDNWALLEVSRNTKSKPFISVSISDSYNIDKIRTALLKKSLPLEDLDVFRLYIKDRHRYTQKIVNAETYVKLVQEMPCVKQLILSIPRFFVDHGNTGNTFKELPFVEEMTINSDADTGIQTFLDRCGSTMPNLRMLHLWRFCGLWVQQIGEFQLRLAAYTLESLTIYTSFITRMIKRLKKRDIEKDDFVVIVVEMLVSGERFLYKISLDNSSTICVNDNELKGYVRGVDYLRVHITIKSLQKLIIMRLDENTKSWYPVTLNLDNQ